MKLFIISLAGLVGLFLGSVVGIASASVPVAQASQVSPVSSDNGFSVELPKAPLQVISLQVIHGNVPAKTITPVKVLVCGDFHASLQGPIGSGARHCEYR